MNAESTAPKIPLKTVAVPSEHGGWGFTLEPILLGLLVAPSWAGMGLGVGALAAFFTRHPLKLWLADTKKGRRFPRTLLAMRFALLYGSLGLLGLALAFTKAEGAFWWPLVAASPLVGLQLWFDAHNRGRNLLPEVSGAAALGSVAASMALAGNQQTSVALGLWLLLAMRALAAIVYARAQVMRARGRPVQPAKVYQVEIFALGVVALCALTGLVPWLSVLALGLLLPYSVYTFSKPPVAAKLVGWSQMAFGLLVVLLTAAGYRVGL